MSWRGYRSGWVSQFGNEGECDGELDTVQGLDAFHYYRPAPCFNR